MKISRVPSPKTEKLLNKLIFRLARKVLASVLLPRLQVIADMFLPESLCGFRASRSTIDVVFTWRQLQDKHIEQQRPLYVPFIDLTKAFDLVSRSGLFAILKNFGCPDTLLSIILKLHDGMHATVQVDGSRSRRFPSKRDVKQGCAFAPRLLWRHTPLLPHYAFAPTLPHCSYVHFRNHQEHYCNVVPLKLFNLSRLCTKSKARLLFNRELLHADDATFVATSVSTLQNLCSSFASACAGLNITIRLCKNVVSSHGSSSPPQIIINGTVLQSVDKVSYLGSTVKSTFTNSLRSELDNRIGNAATTYGQPGARVWSNGNLSIRISCTWPVWAVCFSMVLLQPLRWCCVKCLIHHERDAREEQHHTYMWREQEIEWSWHVNYCCLLPQCEALRTCRSGFPIATLAKRGQRTGTKNAVFNAFHLRCLRSILGLSWRDREPNTSVLQATGSYDLVTIIRHRRLRWAGHVCRIEVAVQPRAQR